MKILLLGKNGQVGWELQRSLAALGEVIALDRQGADGLCGDLADLEGLTATIRKLAPTLSSTQQLIPLWTRLKASRIWPC